jgi:hypothetical protein
MLLSRRMRISGDLKEGALTIAAPQPGAAGNVGSESIAQKHNYGIG